MFRPIQNSQKRRLAFQWWLLIVLLLASCSPGLPNKDGIFSPGAPPRLLARTSAARPIAAGEYLFWHDRRGGGAIHGWRHAQNREFAIDAPGAALLASDGEWLAWLDTLATPQRVQTLHLPTQHSSSLALAADKIADLALDDGVLYSWDHAPEHYGIFAFDLARGVERRLADLPRPAAAGRLAAADGLVVWGETTPGAGQPRTALRLARPADGASWLIAQSRPGSGTLSGLAIGGDYIAWSFALEQQIWLYQISSGAQRVISEGAASRPVIAGGTLAWNVRDATKRTQGVVVYDIASGAAAQLVAPGAAFAEVQALDPHGNAVLTVDHRPALGQDLLLASLHARDLQLDSRVETTQTPQSAKGQVQVQGRQFVLSGAPAARWTFDGVHFSLPSRGINGSSFSASTLDNPAATEERREWLDRAEQIGVKTIRIYMDLPGDTAIAAPRPEQIYHFARDELAPRGMRLALVVHNSGRFGDPGGRKMAWLRALLDRFGGVRSPGQGGGWHRPVDRTELLAYISADNEINLHRHPLDDTIPGSPDCRPDNPAVVEIAQDCFDHPNPEKRRRYIQAALGWFERVRDTVKQHATGGRVLITAGMSVDLEKDILGDGQSAVLNYFTRVPGADGRMLPALADLLDFIAPHSYTAQPYAEIVEPIERAAPLFAKPILLEEFGYPTDPIAQPHPQRPNEYKETSLNVELSGNGNLRLVPNRQGLPAGEDIDKLCRYLPKLGSFADAPKRCNPSAPYVVQMNLEAIFDLQQVAGGIAFMLADSDEKDDGSMECYALDAARQLSKNLFSGLFATNHNYRCGGTVNTGRGQIKNTGYRVCVAYRTHNPQLGDYHRRVAECEIDLE